MPGTSLGTYHGEFSTWIDSQGVVTDGVTIAVIQDRGQGIVASRPVKKGERLVHVPALALLTVSGPHAESGLSVHGAMAQRLMRECCDPGGSGEGPPLATWAAMMPTRQNMDDCMCLTWSELITERLPEGARVLLKRQRAKFEDDWQAFRSHCDGPTSMNRSLYEIYRYYWLLVNTRCFYWEYANTTAKAVKSKTRRQRLSMSSNKRARDDCMAMAPFIDIFNHGIDANPVSYNDHGFTIVASRDYSQGEEIHLSYGAHSNDFLLVEYGFTIADSNPHDCILLDTHMPRLSWVQKEMLRNENMLGDCALTPGGICHRTHAALLVSLPGISNSKFYRFLTGLYGGLDEQVKVEEMTLNVFGALEAERNDALAYLMLADSDGRASRSAIAAVKERWRQIYSLLAMRRVAIEEHSSNP